LQRQISSGSIRLPSFCSPRGGGDLSNLPAAEQVTNFKKKYSVCLEAEKYMVRY
jgi:hypothetical protein